MIMIVGAFLATWLLFAFLGLGPYVMIFGQRGFRPSSIVIYPPLFGCACVVVALTHCVWWQIDISRAIVPVAVVLAVASAMAACAARAELTTTLRRCVRSLRWLGLVGVGMALGCLYLWSTSRDGHLNSPYRVGIDQVGYITTACTLLDGGTLGTVESRLMADLCTTSRSVAMARIESSIDYTNQVSAVFLLGAVRWGFSALLVFLATILRLPHPALAVYPLLALAHVLLFWLVCEFCRRACRSLGFSLRVVTALSATLNANVLNVGFDGQLGQAFCLPFFFSLWWLFISHDTTSTGRSSGRDRRIRRAAFVSAVLAAATIYPTFGELMLILAAIAVLSIPVDTMVALWHRQAFPWRRYAFLAVAACAGLVLLGGYGLTWLNNVGFTRLKDVRIAGWWQPHWATPTEILGFHDMYRFATYHLVRRWPDDLRMQIVANAVLLAVVAWGAAKSRAKRLAVWLPPLLFVVAIFFKTRYIEQIHNYQYMKSYTVLGPILWLCFATECAAAMGLRVGRGSARIFDRTPGGRGRRLATAAILIPTIVGVSSVRRFHETGHFFIVDDLVSMSNPKIVAAVAGHAMFTPRPVLDEIAVHSLAFAFPFHWFHPQRQLEPAGYRDWPIAIYLERKNTLSPDQCVAVGHPVLLHTSSHMVVESGIHVADILDPDTHSIDWPRLERVAEKLQLSK